ncbi:MAG: Omp28-related outer membrane protein [Bacteroidales bacterium]|nr:Omp28-related outer membrane protein [Bacteroidales bacterium]
MEKKLYLLMAVVATIFSSCMEEVLTEDLSECQAVVIQAVTESDGRTRTSLGTASGGVSQVLWTAEDQIGVYPDDAEKPALFRLIAGEGKSSADFSGPVAGQRFSAVYPYSIAGKRQGSGIAVTLPEQQAYVPGSFAPGAFPMAASETAGGTLSFRNLCAILKLSITGHQAVTAIEFLPNDPAVKVSGPATVSFPSGTAAPVLSFASDALSRVLLQVPGVLLDAKTATDFYLVLPARTYKGGFTVRVHTSGGSMDKVYGADFTMDRSSLHASTPFELRLDKGVEPSLFLSGSGTIEDPLRIASLGDLLLMESAVNTGSGTVPTSSGTEVQARTAHYRLTADLDLSPLCGKELGKHWTPIGDTATDDGLYFGGSFDGGGHAIRNLYIDNPKDYQGLFGHIISRDGLGIANLTVSGYVHGKSRVGLFAGHGDRFSNCISEGEVLADGEDLGGIAGWGTTLTDCVNRASVSKTRGMTYTVGGIVGRNEGYDSLPLCRGCRNEGKVYSLEGYQIGGIVGFTSGIVDNCSNSGEVYGGQQCGGIAGCLSVSAVVANCINTGPVSSGYGYSGGIVGTLILYNRCRVVNCVSVNTAVERQFGTDGAAICGYNGGTIEQCFGLASAQMVALNAEGGTVVSCQPVTSDQFSDADTGRVLYLSSDGIPCTSVCQALNAWAYDNRTQERIYSGWGYRDGSLYLTGEPAANPSGGGDVFRMIPDSAEMGPEGGSLPVSVYSTIGYHLSSVPSWVSDAGKKAVDGLKNVWVHNFTVSPNPGGETRTGVIVFCNDNNVCIPVTVLQYGTKDFNWAASFAHQSLIYHFSATWSGFCPEMTTLLADWQQKNPGRFQRVVFHATSSGLAFSGYGPLQTNYRADGLPLVILDGRIVTNNLSDYLALSRETESVLGTKTGIAIRSSLSGRKLSLDLDLYCKKGGKYKVVVLLLEDKVVYRQDVGFSGSDANYVHNDLARMALTDVLGDAVTASDRSKTPLSYSVEIPSSYKIDNMRILAYVLIPGDFEYGSYVDNCVSVKVGQSCDVIFAKLP